MEPTGKIDEELLRFLNSTTKPALIPLIIQTVNGLKEEDKGIVYSRGGEITQNLRITNSYGAQLPADLSVVKSIATELRVTYIRHDFPLPNRERVNVKDGIVQICPPVLICTVKGLTEEQKTFILNQGGDLKREFSSIKSYTAYLPPTVMQDLALNDHELTIIYNIPDILSPDFLMKCAKTGSREELEKELEKIYG